MNNSSHALTPQPTTTRLRRTGTPPAQREADTNGSRSRSTNSTVTTGAVNGKQSSELPPDARRLLALCWELAARGIIAGGHHDPTAPGLLELLALRVRIEETLEERHPHLAAVLTEIAVWEGERLHVDDGPAQQCLTCRRILQERPELAAQAQIGGAR
ncbi:MAG: hypothetical protein ACTHQ3_09465 [Motilibacteraceae bacterium]